MQNELVERDQAWREFRDQLRSAGVNFKGSASNYLESAFKSGYMKGRTDELLAHRRKRPTN